MCDERNCAVKIIDKVKRLFRQPNIQEIPVVNPLVESFRKGECPDCHGKDFYEGPSGGMCTNYKCANPDCGHRFNIGFAGGLHVFYAERI